MAANKKQTWLLSDSSNVMITFGLENVPFCKHLTDWQNSVGFLEPYELQWLNHVRQDLVYSWNVWNESQRRTVRTQNASC